MTYQIKYVTADLFSGEHANVIAHGCNTAGAMGAGVAKIVHDRYPSVYKTYRSHCNALTFEGGSALLCTVWEPGPIRDIINLGTQISPGVSAKAHLIATSFTNMVNIAGAFGIDTIGIPRIGCGIGGMTWDAVEAAIVQGLETITYVSSAQTSDLTIIVHDLPEVAK